MGVAALAGCGEIVPIDPPDGGPGPVPPDAVPADNADLAILDLGAYGDLSPEFNRAETSYTASFSLLVQQIEVSATPVNPAATVSINGVAIVPGQRADDVSLDPAGDTPITVEVQAPAGNRKTYTIVARPDGSVRQYVYGKASNPGGAADPFGQDGTFGNEIGDEFGFWIDTDGDTIVIGARLEDSNATGIDGDQANDLAINSGAAYVFRRQNNVWRQEAYLKASNTGAFDEFGRGVAIDSNLIAVGAPFEASASSGIDGNQDSDGLDASGAVYIFRRTGTEWRQEAYVKPSNPQFCGLFGLHVSVDNDVLVVGAPGCFDAAAEGGGDPNWPNDGSAYVFRYNGVTWEEEAVLKASNPERGDQFGFQVNVDDDVLAIGAIGESSSLGGDAADPAAADNLAPLAGAVYTFERREEGWVQTDYIKPQDPDGRLLAPPSCFDASNIFQCEGDRVGVRVELDEDTLVIGGHLDDSGAREVNGDQLDNSVVNSGAAWVYRRNDDGTWSQEAYLKPTNTGAFDFFGQNFGISGDLLAVAANAEDSGAAGVGGVPPDNDDAPNSGAVYLYRREGTTWQQIEYIKAATPDRDDNFGFNIAMSSSLLVVGAVWEWGGVPGINGDEDDQTAPVSGAFYVFQ